MGCLKMAGEEDIEIPDTGAVFTFGRSRFADNQSSHFFIRNDPVLEISCGDEYTGLICEKGRVFIFGHNDYGQLGLGHTKTITKPSCLKFMKPYKCEHIACGKGHTLISTECGKLFSFGSNSDGQLGHNDFTDKLTPHQIKIDFLENDHICCISAGCLHSAFLTVNGDIFLWGSNSDGQCGLGDAIHFVVPTKLSVNNPVTYVSCGYYHSAIITEGGNLYTFGEGDSGKLGLNSISNQNSPQRVEVNEKLDIVKCGGNHTLAVTVTGKVFAFGSNFSGQLGLGISESEILEPTLIQFSTSHVKIRHVSCGESHSAFLTDNGQLYTAGDARHGKLCNEDESTNQMSPCLISTFDNYICCLVSCGGCHTMVIAKSHAGENESDVVVQKQVGVLSALPPLKVRNTGSEVPVSDSSNGYEEMKNDEQEVIDIQSETNNDEVHVPEKELIDDFDTKSNTESTMILEEVENQEQQHQPDVPVEINAFEPEITNNDNINEDVRSPEVDSDVIVHKEQSRISKLFNVFRKKRSVSAVVIDNTVTKTHEGNGNGDEQVSRACVII